MIPLILISRNAKLTIAREIEALLFVSNQIPVTLEVRKEMYPNRRSVGSFVAIK